jgi:hypothetical protein
MLISSLLGLDLNSSPSEFQAAHNAGSIEENSGQLAQLGTDLKKSRPTGLKKAVFICCNTYTRPEYSLGVGPMNDAITVAHYISTLGWTILYAHNPKSQEFMSYLEHCIKNTSEYLLVYYTGHGGSVADTSGDEADGKDEALVFDDAFVIDDKLLDLMKRADKPASSKICLLNDCCHSGSIYDLASGKGQPERIMCLSAARDAETAKQTSVGGTDQGIFTFYFFKLLTEKPNMTPTEMESAITPYIKKYDQCFTKSATTASLLTQPIFG